MLSSFMMTKPNQQFMPPPLGEFTQRLRLLALFRSRHRCCERLAARPPRPNRTHPCPQRKRRRTRQLPALPEHRTRWRPKNHRRPIPTPRLRQVRPRVQRLSLVRPPQRLPASAGVPSYPIRRTISSLNAPSPRARPTSSLTTSLTSEASRQWAFPS